MISLYHRNWKSFICHVHEDKKLIVEPLVKFLSARGSDIWYDEISIREGKKIPAEIQKGLKEAKGGVVIFSKDFIKSHEPEEREWAKEEFFVLVFKQNTENCFLIPVFYNIDPDKLPECFNGPLDHTKGFVLKEGANNISMLADHILKIVENERIDYVGLKKKQQKLGIKYISLIVLGIILLYFIIIQVVKTEPDNHDPVSIRSINEDKEKNIVHAKTVPITEIIKHNDFSNRKKSTEDYSAYVNSSLINSTRDIEVCVTIIDEKVYVIDNLLSDYIANIYTKTGKKGSIGLLRTSFIQKPEFKELFEANAEIIKKLQLGNYTDFLALGKVNYSFCPGTFVKGTIVCKASLTMSIISTNQMTLIRSFSFSTNANGVTESQAHAEAIQKLIVKYYNEYSSL